MLLKSKKVATYIWPIKRYELKKFIPMLIIFFLIGFIYNILKNTKDALVITGQDSGAEIIPFIKVWLMLPGALLMTSIFSKLSNRFSMEKVFYIMISIFIVFFAFFTFLLYPHAERLHLHTFGDFLQNILPTGCAGLIAMIRFWSYTLFYVMSELWSCIVLSMLFWGFANEVTSVGEATRFYGLFGIGMNLSAIAAGQISILLSRFHMASDGGSWETTLTLLTMAVIVVGLLIMLMYRWMIVYVLPDKRFYSLKEDSKRTKASYKMSLRKNFSYLAKSKYLISIALIVLSYSLVINFVEVLWKDQIGQLYPDPNDYNIYINKVTMCTGVIATLIAFFSATIIKICGWTKTALIVPVILLTTSIVFFFCFFCNDMLYAGIVSALGITPLALVVLFGSTQNIMSRAMKFTLFDATKELAFVPLGDECKRKGKAAIDGVGSRLGKSGSSLIFQGLLMGCSGLTATAPIVACLLAVMIVVWIISIKVLGKEFNTLVKAQETMHIEDEEPSLTKTSTIDPQTA